MKRLTTTDMANSGIMEIQLDPEVHEELIKRTLTALRKFSSNRKTKAVHRILTNKLLTPSIFMGTAADYLMAPIHKNNTLRQMRFNLYFFDDSLNRTGAVGYASDLETIERKIQKEKTFLGDKQVYNLEQLNNDKKELNEKFLSSIDYIKLVDGTYFGWLIMLALSSVEGSGATNTKTTIVTTTANILADILKKMYLKVNSSIEPEVHQLLEAIAIYFINIYFYGETAQYSLNKMQGVFNEETLETIKKARVTQFKDFNELSILLKETQLLPLTTNTFDLQMQKMFGKYGYDFYIKNSLMNFIAFMANLANPSQLFKDAFELDDESHKRLEELLLNEAKGIKLEKGEF